MRLFDTFSFLHQNRYIYPSKLFEGEDRLGLRDSSIVTMLICQAITIVYQDKVSYIYKQSLISYLEDAIATIIRSYTASTDDTRVPYALALDHSQLDSNRFTVRMLHKYVNKLVKKIDRSGVSVLFPPIGASEKAPTSKTTRAHYPRNILTVTYPYKVSAPYKEALITYVTDRVVNILGANVSCIDSSMQPKVMVLDHNMLDLKRKPECYIQDYTRKLLVKKDLGDMIRSCPVPLPDSTVSTDTNLAGRREIPSAPAPPAAATLPVTDKYVGRCEIPSAPAAPPVPVATVYPMLPAIVDVGRSEIPSAPAAPPVTAPAPPVTAPAPPVTAPAPPVTAPVPPVTAPVPPVTDRSKPVPTMTVSIGAVYHPQMLTIGGKLSKP